MRKTTVHIITINTLARGYTFFDKKIMIPNANEKTANNTII